MERRMTPEPLIITNGQRAIIDHCPLRREITFSRNIAPVIGAYLFRFHEGRFTVTHHSQGMTIRRDFITWKDDARF